MSEKHRTGRPLKEHPAGTQVTITLQVPAELKSKLQSHALSSNRTLSQEAQRRLERSFSVQALQEDAVSLAVEETHAQVSKQLRERLRDELARAKVDTEQRLAELRRQADETVRHQKTLVDEALQKMRARTK